MYTKLNDDIELHSFLHINTNYYNCVRMLYKLLTRTTQYTKLILELKLN